MVLFTYIVHKYEELNNIAKKICIFAGRTICHPIRIVQDDNTSLEFINEPIRTHFSWNSRSVSKSVKVTKKLHYILRFRIHNIWTEFLERWEGQRLIEIFKVKNVKLVAMRAGLFIKVRKITYKFTFLNRYYVLIFHLWEYDIYKNPPTFFLKLMTQCTQVTDECKGISSRNAKQLLKARFGNA